jgi:hypothetical protein
MPADVDVSSPFGSYSVKYAYANGVITVDYRDVESAFRIPLSQLTAYLDFTSGISQQMSKSIVLKKTVSGAAH